METTRQDKKKFHEINGFLSLQLWLSFELGLRLRLTKNLFGFLTFSKVQANCKENVKIPKPFAGGV